MSAAEDDGPAGVGAGGRRLTAPGTRRPSPGSEPRGLGGEMLPRGGRRFVSRKRWAVRADAVRGESRHGPRLGRSCSLSLRSRHLILINCEGGSFLSTGVPFDLPSTCLWRPAETPWLLPGLSCVTGTSVTCEGPSGAVRMEPPAARRLVEDGNPKMVPVFVLMQGRVWWMACGRGRLMPWEIGGARDGLRWGARGRLWGAEAPELAPRPVELWAWEPVCAQQTGAWDKWHGTAPGDCQAPGLRGP